MDNTCTIIHFIEFKSTVTSCPGSSNRELICHHFDVDTDQRNVNLVFTERCPSVLPDDLSPGPATCERLNELTNSDYEKINIYNTSSWSE